MGITACESSVWLDNYTREVSPPASPSTLWPLHKLSGPDYWAGICLSVWPRHFTIHQLIQDFTLRAIDQQPTCSSFLGYAEALHVFVG